MFVVCSFFHSVWSAMTNCFGFGLERKRFDHRIRFKRHIYKRPGLQYLPTSFQQRCRKRCMMSGLSPSCLLVSTGIISQGQCYMPSYFHKQLIFATQLCLKYPLVSVQIVEYRHLPEASFSVFSEGLANFKCILGCNQKQCNFRFPRNRTTEHKHYES